VALEQDVGIAPEGLHKHWPLRVLLVEHDPDTRALIANALGARGITVDEANDANAALAIARYAPPDVIVYSVGWSSGVHRLHQIEDAAEHASGHAPAIVVITPIWMRLRNRGVTLRGPLRVPELLRAIDRAIELG
jgi:CheY-like chemotaxis protein